MSLRELAPAYRESARKLSERLGLLRRELKACNDPEEAFKLQRRIAELTPMLTEVKRCLHAVENYYATCSPVHPSLKGYPTQRTTSAKRSNKRTES